MAIEGFLGANQRDFIKRANHRESFLGLSIVILEAISGVLFNGVGI